MEYVRAPMTFNSAFDGIQIEFQASGVMKNPVQHPRLFAAIGQMMDAAGCHRWCWNRRKHSIPVSKQLVSLS
jgi:hypothetical protein